MLVEVAILGVVLSREPDRCGSGERVLCVTSHSQGLVLTGERAAHPEVLVGGNIEAAMARDFSFVPEVQNVLIEHVEENLLVWIALDNPTREVRERVFDKELSLIEGFPETDFDFNLIPALGRTPQQLASNAKVIYSREDDHNAQQG